MRFALPLILICGLIAAIAVATHRPPPRPDLCYKNRGSIHTLDPATMSYMEDMMAALALWEGLMRYDPKTTAPIPGMAEGMPEVTENATRYVFTIRSNARWSNGDSVTTADFIRAWRRAIEPGTADTYSEIIGNYIRGAHDYMEWRTQYASVLGTIRQLGKNQFIKGADLRRALLSEAGGPLREHLITPLPEPPPDEADDCWNKAARELRESHTDFAAMGDNLLVRHYAEIDKHFEQVGIKALDDRHLEVRLNLSTPYFLDLTGFSTYLPVHKSIDILRDSYTPKHASDAGAKMRPIPLTDAGLQTYDWQWTKSDYHRNGYPGLISNGAYVLKHWYFKQYIWLEANPYYWNPEDVKSKTIEIKDVEDLNAAFMLYEQSDLDWFLDLRMDYTPELVRAQTTGHRNDIHFAPSFGTYYLTINCAPYLLDGRPNFLANRHLRRAITMSLDRQSIVDNVERLRNPVMTTFVPPNQIPGYESPQGLGFDVARAKEELKEAGYASGQDVPVIEILYNTNEGHEGKMQAAKRMWEENLGLRIQLVAKETKAFAEDKDKGRFMLGRGGWFGDYNDPTTFLDLFQSENGNNVGKFKDAKYDAMLDQAAHEVDVAKRLKILSEAEKYVMVEQVPIVPFFCYVTVDTYRPKVTGIYQNPRLQYPLQAIEVNRN